MNLAQKIRDERKKRKRNKFRDLKLYASDITQFSLPDNPSWYVGMTTAPRRESTIQRTIQSIQQAGWDSVNVFAEPGSDITGAESLFQNKTCLGGWNNFLQVIQAGVDSNSNAILYVQDDIIFSTNTRQYVESNWSGHSLTSLYLSSRYYFGKRWTPYRGELIGILALVLSREVAQHLLRTYPHRSESKHFDTALSNWAASYKIPICYHSPSLVQHIGDTSTIHGQVSNSGSRRSGTFQPFLQFDDSIEIISATAQTNLRAKITETKQGPVQPKEVWIVADTIQADEARNIGADRIIICEPDGSEAIAKAIAPHTADIIQTKTTIEPITPHQVLQHCGRLGLIGWNTRSGLGTLNRDIAKYLNVNWWLIPQHPYFETLPPPSNTRCTISPRNVSDDLYTEFLDSIDTLLFCETPEVVKRPDVLHAAKRRGIQIVCVPMIEWLPYRSWTSQVDIFLCPTRQCYDQMEDLTPQSQWCPWLIDTNEIIYRPRHRCNSFLFIHGTGGRDDRKGGQIVAEAASLAPDIPLIVYSQGMRSRRYTPPNWPSHVDLRGEQPNLSDLYSEGDICIQPSRFEGLGLQLLECQVAGLPLITTDGLPMGEYEPFKSIRSIPSSTAVERSITKYDACPRHLAELMRELHNTNIEIPSLEARQFALSRSWEKETPSTNREG